MLRVARSPLVARLGRTLLTASLAGALLVALAPKTRSQSQVASDDTRLHRTIRGMEEVFDDMFIESRNVLVQSHEATSGHYLPEFGVLFTAEVSILDRRSWYGKKTSWNWVFDNDDDDDDWDDDDDRASVLTRQEKQYGEFKDEVMEALMSGGDNFSGRLSDNQWVGVSIGLENSRYFRKHKLHQLNMKARVSDLKAYANGTLSESAMKAKIEVTES
jgi:hypothetical protein